MIVRQFEFHAVRHAEEGADAQPLFDGLHHRGMAVAGKQRAVAEVVIEVFVAVEIVECGRPWRLCTNKG